MQSVCEEEVFDKLYISLAKPIRNHIFYKCGSSSQAEDILHEAFIKLWNKCADVPFEKAKSFLYTVANRLFLNEVKHNKVVLAFKQVPKQEFTEQSPEYLLQEKEFEKTLEDAIGGLPDNVREVFLMNRLEKLKYSDIAERLGVSVKTVEKRMSLALKEMRKIHEKI